MAKKKKSNKLLYILLGVAVLLVAVTLVGKQQGWIGGQAELEVNFAEAAKTTIVEKVSGTGTIQPETEVKLSPDVPGEIIELYIEEGEEVEAGKLLMRIRPDNFELALDRAEASLNQQRANLEDSRSGLSRSEAQFSQAQQSYERNKKLFEGKVISRSEFESADASYKVAMNDLNSAKQRAEASRFVVESSLANLKDAKENLRLTNVIAPLTGTVSKLDVEKGERVVGTQQMQGTEMGRIADLNRMEVEVDVNENDIIRVSKGDTAVIEVDSYTYLDKEFKGLVTEIANTANAKASPDAVTEFKVKILILKMSYQDMIDEGNKYPFRPGMTASVDIITTSKEDILTVPLSAVTTRKPADLKEKKEEGEEGEAETKTASMTSSRDENEEPVEVVFVNRDGAAKGVEVKTGIADFENIEILSGIEEGDQIISGPFLMVSKRLKNGDKVVEAEDKKGRPSQR